MTDLGRVLLQAKKDPNCNEPLDLIIQWISEHTNTTISCEEFREIAQYVDNRCAGLVVWPSLHIQGPHSIYLDKAIFLRILECAKLDDAAASAARKISEYLAMGKFGSLAFEWLVLAAVLDDSASRQEILTIYESNKNDSRISAFLLKFSTSFFSYLLADCYRKEKVAFDPSLGKSINFWSFYINNDNHDWERLKSEFDIELKDDIYILEQLSSQSCQPADLVLAAFSWDRRDILTCAQHLYKGVRDAVELEQVLSSMCSIRVDWRSINWKALENETSSLMLLKELKRLDSLSSTPLSYWEPFEGESLDALL